MRFWSPLLVLMLSVVFVGCNEPGPREVCGTMLELQRDSGQVHLQNEAALEGALDSCMARADKTRQGMKNKEWREFASCVLDSKVYADATKCGPQRTAKRPRRPPNPQRRPAPNTTP